jgi:xylulokinase
VPTPFVTKADGIEMEVADLDLALSGVLAALSVVREQIAAIGIAGMAESGAPLRAGRPTGPIIAWHDGRGAETVASLQARFGADLPCWTGRRVRTVSSVAKLGWLIDQGLPPPDRWLGVPEVVLWLLTGAEATEHSLAARTGAYHVTDRRFLSDVISHVLAPSHATAFSNLFPQVLPAGRTMGVISQGAATRYGPAAGVPVTIAGHDHLAAAVGLGARPDDLFNSVGTAETVLRRFDRAPDVERALELDLAVTVWPGGDAWGVMASATRSGLVIDALAAHLGVEPGRLDAGAEGRAPAETARADRMVPLGQGIEVPAGPPQEMWTATLRMLAGRTAAAAERVAALAGRHRRLVVFGGGSRSPEWLRAKRAEFGVPVVSCPVPEATARGAALSAGTAAGWWPSPVTGPTPRLDSGGRRAGTMGVS